MSYRARKEEKDDFWGRFFKNVTKSIQLQWNPDCVLKKVPNKTGGNYFDENDKQTPVILLN